MSDLLYAILEAVGNGEPIEWIPYDISGYKPTEQMQIYSLYATYGQDPERRRLCKRKYKEVLAC